MFVRFNCSFQSPSLNSFRYLYFCFDGPLNQLCLHASVKWFILFFFFFVVFICFYFYLSSLCHLISFISPSLSHSLFSISLPLLHLFLSLSDSLSLCPSMVHWPTDPPSLFLSSCQEKHITSVLAPYRFMTLNALFSYLLHLNRFLFLLSPTPSSCFLK